MKIISNELIDWANCIEQEINNDKSDWLIPKSDTVKKYLFETGKLQVKSINGNLNYKHVPTMIIESVINDPICLPGFTKTTEFPNYARTLTNDIGPIGLMRIWGLPAGGELLPHKDKFEYHSMVNRNIIIISDNIDKQQTVIINEQYVPTQKGTLFQFDAFNEMHTFNNKSDQPFIFFMFDFWDNDKLSLEKEKIYRPFITPFGDNRQ